MTSIEWLMERYLSQDHSLTIVDFDKAKAMEKEQIDESFKEGYKNGVLTEKWQQTYGGDK